MAREFSVRYLGPTDTKGSRLRVLWYPNDSTEVRVEVSYDYGARDAFATAVSDATGIPVDQLEQTLGFGNTTQRWYAEKTN